MPENRAHAEIQREPRGKMPGKAERERFMEVWRGAIALLKNLKKEDPSGKPELQVVPGRGLELHWRSGHDGDQRRVVQVESVAEAVRAYVGAGLLSEADAAKEQSRLEQDLTTQMHNTPSPRAGTA